MCRIATLVYYDINELYQNAQCFQMILKQNEIQNYVPNKLLGC